MKKLLSLILLFSLSFTFYSCDKDDDKKDEPEKPKPFVWGGDWNDPEDENYKPEYGGKYNPVRGLWRSDKDPSFGLYYSEDFKEYIVTFYPDGRYAMEGTGSSYGINDKAFRVSSTTQIYEVNGNQFLLYSHNSTKDKASYYTRVQEKNK